MITFRQIFLMSVVALLLASALGCSQRTPEVAEQEPATNTASELPAADVTDANQALEEGKRLLDENQTERAIEFFERAVSLNADLAEAHFQLGIAYALLELQYEQEGLLSQSNDNAARKKTKSEASFERAVEAYKKLLKADPQDDVAYYNLGRTYSKLMKDEEAADAFKEAVKIKPDDSEYQTELGGILVKLAKYHEAIEPLRKAVELDVQNVRAQELLEDAQAGRQRIDYVSPKPDANKQASNKANTSLGNATSDSNTNTLAPPRPMNTNTAPSTQPTRRPAPSPTRPQRPGTSM